MSMSGPHFIHFKLKSAALPASGATQWTTISWEGANHLSTLEVKRLIAQHFKLANNSDGFDFLLTNSTTGEEYRDDNFIIHRNTSLNVKRIMGTKERAQILTQPPQIGKLIGSDSNTSNNQTSSSSDQSNGQSNEQLSDEQAILNLVQQSSRSSRPTLASSYAPQTYQRQSPGTQAAGGPVQAPNSKPPPSYVCHRCGGNGHYIRYCPTNGDPTFDGRKPKAAAAVAQYESSNQKFFLKQIEDPKALAAAEAKPAASAAEPNMMNQSFSQSFNQPQAAQHPQPQNTYRPPPPLLEPPRDLCCSLCGQLFVSPQVLPCCFKTVCSACIHNGLRTNPNCPLCSAVVDVKGLKPNHMLGSRVASFQQQQRAAGIYVPPPMPVTMPQLHPAQPMQHPNIPSMHQPSNQSSGQQMPPMMHQPPPVHNDYQPPPSQHGGGYYAPPAIPSPMHQAPNQQLQPPMNQPVNQPGTSPSNQPINSPTNQPMYQPLNQPPMNPPHHPMPNHPMHNQQMYPPPPGDPRGPYPPPGPHGYQNGGYRPPPPQQQPYPSQYPPAPYQQYPPPQQPHQSQSRDMRNEPRTDPRDPRKDERYDNRTEPRRDDRSDRSKSRGEDRSYHRSRSPRRHAPYRRSGDRSPRRSPRRSPPRRRD